MKKLIDDKTIPQILDILEEMHPDAKCALEHRDRFQLLIAVVLSAQTTDVSVNKVTPELFSKYPGPKELASARQEDVQDIIKTIGLYKNKSSNIIKLSQKLMENHGGIVPGEFDALTALPGVGRKTANVVLAEGFRVPRIAVDTHVFRVSNRIGLVDESDVTATEKALMERIPEEKWILAHHLLIFHGRRICTARNPKCGECYLNSICLSSKLVQEV